MAIAARRVRRAKAQPASFLYGVDAGQGDERATLVIRGSRKEPLPIPLEAVKETPPTAPANPERRRLHLLEISVVIQFT